MKTSSKLWMCLAGLALVVFGVLVIKNPGATMGSISVAIGIALLVSGCATFAGWMSVGRLLPGRHLWFFSALAQIILGISVLCSPVSLALVLPLLFAFWLLYEGVSLALEAFDFKRVGFNNWWIVLGLGILVGSLGIYGLYNPEASAATISWLVGLSIIFDGIGYWVRLFIVNKFEKKLESFFNIEDVKEVK